MAKDYKRRNIFIKKNFQGKLILGYFLFVSGGCIFFIVLLSYFSADSLTISYANNNLQLGQTPIMLMKNIIAAHWIFIVVGTIFLVFVVMFITHRIAGPLFRFEKSLDNMLANNLDNKISLRQKDEGKELAVKINQFNHELSKSIRAIHSSSRAITDLIEHAAEKSSEIPGDLQKELQSLYWGIEDNNRKIQDICSSYSLRDE